MFAIFPLCMTEKMAEYYVKHNGTVYPNNYPLGDCHNERKTSCGFIDNVIDIFPFRIREARTDRGLEVQAKYHWHIGDKSICHCYIKPRPPQLNRRLNDRIALTRRDSINFLITSIM